MKSVAGFIRVKECWVEVGELVRVEGREAKAAGPPLSTTPIQQGPPSPLVSSPPLSGLVFKGPASLQDVWCGSLDAGFLCIGRGTDSKVKARHPVECGEEAAEEGCGCYTNT